MVKCSECGREGKMLAREFREYPDGSVDDLIGDWYCEDCYDFITKDDKCGCEPVANFGIIMTALLDIKKLIKKLEKDQEESNKILSKWLSDFGRELGKIETGLYELVKIKKKVEEISYVG